MLFGLISKKSLPSPQSQRFPHVFWKSIGFMFIFRSVIHFEFIFDYDVKYRSKFLLFACGYQVFPAKCSFHLRHYSFHFQNVNLTISFLLILASGLASVDTISLWFMFPCLFACLVIFGC